MENTKQQLEEVIKKNLPEKKLPPHSDDEFIKIAKENGITITSENLSDIVKNMMLSMDNARFWEYRQGFNDCLSTIPVSLIADEVLKVVKERDEKLENMSNCYAKIIEDVYDGEKIDVADKKRRKEYGLD